MTDVSKHLCSMTGRRLYVISDLHMGDGSSRDNLVKGNKSILLQRFLDEVETQDGMLVVLGDLFELWRYPADAILEHWQKLIDRMSQMDLIYVPGNHDALFDKRFEKERTMHPIFKKLHQPFVSTIGGQRFKFMHGHEIDPMISDGMIRMAPVLRLLTGAFEFRQDQCLITCDRVSDALLEAGEQFLHGWHKMTRQFDQAVYEHLGFTNEQLAWLKRPLRTRKMLARFFREQRDGLYDVTITGHTHKAGRFGQWYFNSGCWTQPVVNYLVIQPDGAISVQDWTADGSLRNRTLVHA